jgi:DNA topoisomerase-3
MPVVFMVCEKPSIAESIARVLSRNSFNTRRGKLTVHTFQAPFRHYGSCMYKVAGLFGHVYGTDFPSYFNSWQNVKPIELYDAPVEKKEEKGRQISYVLEQEAKGVDFLVLCLDCDREGENICFEVISIVEHKLSRNHGEKQIYRARFSAVTEQDLSYAMNNLTVPNENESLSVDARQELDLKVGVTFTRYKEIITCI